MDKHSIRVTKGSPDPAEEAAIRAAILKIWRDDVADAMRGGGESAWVVASRAAAGRTRPHQVASPHAWAMSLRFDAGPMSARRTGRGDSK